MNELLNQILPLLITFVVGALALIFRAVGKAVIELLIAKREEAILRLGKEEYGRRLDIAFDVWRLVDEHFRLNDLIKYSINDKMSYFNDVLLERIPALKQEDLDYLRQVVAGIVNEGREKGIKE